MTKHTKISFVKSAVRIVGFALLPCSLFAAAIFLILAEGLGIYEEVGANYK